MVAYAAGFAPGLVASLVIVAVAAGGFAAAVGWRTGLPSGGAGADQVAVGRPFGVQGSRVQGRVRLEVFGEYWGFSASVEPVDLRFEAVEGGIVRVERSAASLQSVEYGDPTVTAARLPRSL